LSRNIFGIFLGVFLGDNFIIETAIKGNVRYLVSRDDDVKLDKGVSNFLSQ
jgi:hypothetical protein